jgi:hypothetical protein
MEDNKLKFVVHGREEGNKFVLEEITNYILSCFKMNLIEIYYYFVFRFLLSETYFINNNL